MTCSGIAAGRIHLLGFGLGIFDPVQDIGYRGVLLQLFDLLINIRAHLQPFRHGADEMKQPRQLVLGQKIDLQVEFGLLVRRAAIWFSPARPEITE